SAGQAVDVSENIMKAVGNVIWDLTFGIHLDFDNDIVMYFCRIQQGMLSMMAGPLMMWLEVLP
ncbi:hypothetical protein PENTCL1PPCAC_24751, partial [Pristionchus entomophagus]